MTHQHY